MSWTIMAYGPVSGPELIAGEYLKAYDPEAFDGRGDAVFTNDVAEAMTFKSMEEALTFAHRTPKARPLRADGRPNRPLTAFTLEVVAL
jgi:hypothetical protein